MARIGNKQWTILASLLVSLSLLFGASLMGCEEKKEDKKEEKKEEKAEPCATKFAELKDASGELSCSCDADALKGSVWGSGVYTSDSAICAAALHAGAVTEEGGEVKVAPAEGCGAYLGSAANGVSSNSWGPWNASFYFPGHSETEGKCDNTCPRAYKSVQGLDENSEMVCKCAGGHSGSVWGDGIYTHDSDICSAAQHAGAIPAEGGEVTVKAAAGCKNYAAAEKNGISSRSWGEFGGSFYFAGHGDGECGNFCPDRFNGIKDLKEDTEITCECAANPTGSLYGTNIYTIDSSICAAAAHAGVIKAEEGGEVTAKAAPGCEKYEGTEANGQKSASWGAYDSSFYFPSTGEPVCAK